MAISQISRDCPGRDYYLRKRAAGKAQGGHALSETTTVGRGLPLPPARRQAQQAASPGGHQGGGYRLQRGRLDPYHRLFGQVTSRTRQHRPYKPRRRPT
jgi:hypothetical protein